jgi:hypothetical protein
MALGVSGGGAAVVALSARNIPGLQIVVNVSGFVRNGATTRIPNQQAFDALSAAHVEDLRRFDSIRRFIGYPKAEVVVRCKSVTQ